MCGWCFAWLYYRRPHRLFPVRRVVVEFFISRAWRSIYTCTVQRKCSEHFCAASCVPENLPICPRFSPTIFYRDANSVLLRAHLCTEVGSMRRTLCSKMFIRRVSLKVYLHMYNENVQQNPLCAASCVTKDIPISPRFSPTISYRQANSVLYIVTVHIF